MGSDPQSYLQYLHEHCDCAASEMLPIVKKQRDELREKLGKSTSQRETDLAKQLNNVYSERALLVAFLSSIFKSGLEKATDGEPGFTFVLYLDTPFGQVSWHVADSDLDLFKHVPRDREWKWDGHTSDQKRERILKSIGWLVERHVTF